MIRILCALPLAGAALVFPETKIPLLVYAGVSALTFFAYGIDKALAVKNRERRGGNGFVRISEKTLHRLELFGGFAGALLGQIVWRHKSVKKSYRAAFLGIVCLHCSAWLAAAAFLYFSRA